MISFGVLGFKPLHWIRLENGLDFEIPRVTGPKLATPPYSRVRIGDSGFEKPANVRKKRT